MDPRLRRLRGVFERAGINPDRPSRELDTPITNAYVGVLEGTTECTVCCARDLTADELVSLSQVAQGEVILIFPESFGEVLGDKVARDVIAGREVAVVNTALIKMHVICVIDGDSREGVVFFDWATRDDPRITLIGRDRVWDTLHARIWAEPRSRT